MGSNLEDKRITKIKFEGPQTTVTLTEEYDGWSKNIVIKSYDERHADFTEAMQKLAVEVVRLLNLPDAYVEDMSVTGLSLSENDHQGAGAVVTCQKSLPGINSPLVINTPHVHDDECEQGNSVIPMTMRLAINEVERHAEAFVNGKRAQGDIFQQAA